MNHFNMLSETELEKIYGADGLENVIKVYEWGELAGRWLAHRPNVGYAPEPFCYHYGPAYPAPVLPCRN